MTRLLLAALLLVRFHTEAMTVMLTFDPADAAACSKVVPTAQESCYQARARAALDSTFIGWTVGEYTWHWGSSPWARVELLEPEGP